MWNAFGVERAALQALAEKWPDETTLELLRSQLDSYELDWTRSGIEKTIKTLRDKLHAG